MVRGKASGISTDSRGRFPPPLTSCRRSVRAGGYDVYLLDIIMPHLNGIDVAQKVRERGETAELLFLTTSREYAVEAFSVKASGYLIKPVQKMDFEQEMLHCIQNLAPKENPAILLKTKEGIRRMHIREIVMVESFNHSRVCILSDGTAVETSATLSSLYEQLQEYACFFLPHRAYIVNLDYVNGLTPTELMMAGGQRVPVSRNIYPKLKEGGICDTHFEGVRAVIFRGKLHFTQKKLHLTQEMNFFCVFFYHGESRKRGGDL